MLTFLSLVTRVKPVKLRQYGANLTRRMPDSAAIRRRSPD
jgi:hypothetical protein